MRVMLQGTLLLFHVDFSTSILSYIVLLSLVMLNRENLLSAEFNTESSEFWYNPVDTHGTHVTGIIAAAGNNGIGVRGVVSDLNSGVCMLVARAFGDFTAGTTQSSINNAMEWW
jgi:subtilisin family serine protease